MEITERISNVNRG